MRHKIMWLPEMNEALHLSLERAGGRHKRRHDSVVLWLGLEQKPFGGGQRKTVALFNKRVVFEVDICLTNHKKFNKTNCMLYSERRYFSMFYFIAVCVHSKCQHICILSFMFIQYS